MRTTENQSTTDEVLMMALAIGRLIDLGHSWIQSDNTFVWSNLHNNLNNR